MAQPNASPQGTQGPWNRIGAVDGRAAAATESLHRRYDRAVERSNLTDRTDEPDRFRGLVPDWLSAALIAANLGFTLLNAFVLISIPTLHEVGGPVRVFRFVAVAPFGHVPVLATFTMWTQLLVGVMIPKAIQLLLSAV